jgi:DhnA family fructose-bisphosphate aldolase class Ia
VIGADGRVVIVAIDHALYSWPCPGLEDRSRILRAVVDAGADAVIASYGTIRDRREDFGAATPILKLDLTTVTLGGSYPATDYVLAWTVDDAVRLAVTEVLTYVQLGADSELDALRAAATVASAADRAGIRYVCEIMPVESPRFPDPTAPDAIAAATRTGAELGAHVVKTSMPSPPGAIDQAVAAGVPVVLAGGDPTSDRDRFLDAIRAACDAGAAGVAVGRNVWGAPEPGEMVRLLVRTVHDEATV